MRTPWRYSLFASLAVIVLLNVSVPTSSYAQQVPNPVPCNPATQGAVTSIRVGQAPFFYATATDDGCWIFVALRGVQRNRLSVLHQEGGAFKEVRAISFGDGPSNWMMLTHDQRVLIAETDTQVAFVDVSRLKSGQGNPVLGYLSDQHFGNPTGLSVTSDDKLLFVAQRTTDWISIVDLEKVRSGVFSTSAIIGGISTGGFPVSVAVSPDQKYLYATIGSDRSNGQPVCQSHPIPGQGPLEYEGSIIVIDVQKAQHDPASALVASVRAGCLARYLAIAPNGKNLYSVAEADNALLAFDTARVGPGSPPVLLGRVPVGIDPTHLEVIENGRKVIIANSNQHYSRPNDLENLTVVDTSKVGLGADAVVGKITAGADPRHMFLVTGGKTLLVMNYRSQTLQIIDLTLMPLQ